MEIQVVLKKMWIKNAGTYQSSISFYSNDESLESIHKEGSKFDVRKVDGSWLIGPWHADSSTDVDFGAICFVCKLSRADGTKPVMLAHKLYQEKPDSLPSTSDEDAAVSLQVIGLGKLDLNKLQFLHSKSRHEMIFEETVNQRVQIFSCSEVGGIRMNLGSLLVTTKFHETRPREQTAIESSQIVTDRVRSRDNLPDRVLSIASDAPTSPVSIDEKLNKSIELTGNDPVAKEFERRNSISRIHHQQFTEEAERKLAISMQMKESFPAMDAVRSILPSYYRLVKSPPNKRKSVAPYRPIEEPSDKDAVLRESPTKVRSVPSEEEASKGEDLSQGKVGGEEKKMLDQNVIAVLEYQAKELDRYRQAIRQMGEHVVGLRSQISSLEMKNSQLRADLYYSNQSDYFELRNGQPNDSMPLDLLRKNMKLKSEEVEEQRVLIQKQQNELIKKNEYEGKYLKLLQAHQSQQSVIHEYQAKIAKYRLLEKTCKQQEKIIDELENTIGGNKLSHPRSQEHAKSVKFEEIFHPAEKSDAVVPASLAISNVKRRCMPQPKQQPQQPQQQQSKSIFRDHYYDLEDKLVLMQKLEKAEGRVIALERQDRQRYGTVLTANYNSLYLGSDIIDLLHISDNTRQWAREKSNYKLRITDGLSEFPGYHRHYNTTSLPFPSNYIGESEPYHPRANGQLRGYDTFSRFHHL